MLNGQDMAAKDEMGVVVIKDNTRKSRSHIRGELARRRELLGANLKLRS